MAEFRSGTERLFYDEAGAGDPAIIFIHGFLASSLMWRDFGYLGALPKGFRAYAADMRGHGRSSAIQTGCNLKQMAEDVAALTDQLGLVKPFIVGMSMGGGVALQLALSYPDLPGGLVLLSPGFGSPLNGIKRLLYPVLCRIAQKPGPLTRMLTSAFVKLPPDEVTACLLEDAMRVSRNTWRQYLHPSNVLDDPRDLRRIRIPVRVIFGAKDRAIPPALTRRMAALIPTADKVEYPLEGHGVVAENPQRVRKDLFEFIAEARKAA